MQNISKIKDELNDNQAFLIKNQENRRYLTSFNSSDGFLIIKKADERLFVDSRYFENAKINSKIKTDLFLNFDSLKDFLADIQDIFIETDKTSLNEYERLQKFFDDKNILNDNKMTEILKQLRRHKSIDEKNKILRAQEIAEKALDETLAEIRTGITEKELAAKLEYNMSIFGSEKPSFETIVLFGEKTSVPHGVPGDKKLKKNDIILIDFGAVFEGYHSDMTRTLLVGDPGEKIKTIYDLVLKAQEECVKAVKNGIKLSRLHNLAIELFGDKSKYFTHSLGHGVGLDIHENPTVSFKSEQVLENGDIITIEPGLYFENEFGIRIEDMIYMNNNKSENLTKYKK